MNTTFFDIELPRIAKDSEAARRIEVGFLWAFVASTDDDADLHRVALAVVVKGLVDANGIAKDAKLPSPRVDRALEHLLRRLLEWQRGKSDRKVFIEPPQPLFLGSILDLEAALAFALTDESIDRIESEVAASAEAYEPAEPTVISALPETIHTPVNTTWSSVDAIEKQLRLMIKSWGTFLSNVQGPSVVAHAASKPLTSKKANCEVLAVLGNEESGESISLAIVNQNGSYRTALTAADPHFLDGAFELTWMNRDIEIEHDQGNVFLKLSPGHAREFCRYAHQDSNLGATLWIRFTNNG